MADGKAGAPKGNDNASKGVRWRNAIETALNKRSKAEGQKALVEIAEKLLEKAAEGDIAALRELGDRIDGKAPQSIETTGTGIQVILNGPDTKTL